jgi:hypothetical protein
MQDKDLLPCPNCGTMFTLETQRRAIDGLQTERERLGIRHDSFLVWDGAGMWKTRDGQPSGDPNGLFGLAETCGNCGTIWCPRARIVAKRQAERIERLRNELHPPLRRLAEAADHDPLTEVDSFP